MINPDDVRNELYFMLDLETPVKEMSADPDRIEIQICIETTKYEGYQMKRGKSSGDRTCGLKSITEQEHALHV